MGLGSTGGKGPGGSASTSGKDYKGNDKGNFGGGFGSYGGLGRASEAMGGWGGFGGKTAGTSVSGFKGLGGQNAGNGQFGTQISDVYNTLLNHIASQLISGLVSPPSTIPNLNTPAGFYSSIKPATGIVEKIRRAISQPSGMSSLVNPTAQAQPYENPYSGEFQMSNQSRGWRW